MFTNLFFIIIVLLLSNFAIELNPKLWSMDTFTACFLFSLLYAVLLFIVFSLTRLSQRYLYLSKNKLIVINNCVIILLLTTGYFLWGPQRILMTLPLVADFSALKMLFLVGLYLFALGFYHYIARAPEKSHDKIHQAFIEIRFLLPFILPFFLMMLFFDLWDEVSFFLAHWPLFSFMNAFTATLLVAMIFLVVLVCIALFMPPVIIKFWKCEPLENSLLKERLENLCLKAHFRHAGMLNWTLIKHNLTAAIVGILPKFRYILFTQRLLNELSPDSIEAVLAHEIGHNYRKHLLIFPFIFMGIPVALGLASLFFEEGIAAWVEMKLPSMDSEGLVLVYLCTIFLGISLFIFLYFRLIFGFFSRLFERQADLHPFVLGLDPQHMIKALEDTSNASGLPAATPNWHHYSIQKRMDFLENCIKNPELIQKHHRWTLGYVVAYFLVLLISSILLLASSLSFIPLFEHIAKAEQQASSYFRYLLTKSNLPIDKEL